jgi:HPt (histidine-containing phosphotransfer) domain-containing protein
VTDTHLDRDVLNALQEVMEGEYPTLLDTFLADSETRLQQLHQAENATQLIEAAHSFKGSSSNMGALGLTALCGQLEKSAATASSDDIARMIAHISHEFALVRPLYETERQRFLMES